MSSLKEYAKRIAEFAVLSRQPSRLVPYLAYYLDEEEDGKAATPVLLGPMFEELRVRPPVNISDVLRKSKIFVRVRSGGYRLSHEGQEMIRAALSPVPEHVRIEQNKGEVITTSQMQSESSSHGVVVEDDKQCNFSKRNILVIYGRDEALREDLFSFLRAAGLNPLEFEEMSHLTGSTSPFTLQVLETAFKNVQACIVLISPDEVVSLRPELRKSEDLDKSEFQPRPNVLIEAGMAIALQPKRTILVRVGSVRSFSDFDGKQYVNFTGSPESRNKLLGMLELAECEVKRHGNDWLTVGNFNGTKGSGK